MKRESQYTLAVSALLLAAFLAALGMTVQRLRESRRPRAVPILMYHKVGPVDDNAWWVPAERFEQQLRDLRNQGYRSILPQDLVHHRLAGRRLPDKPVLITFDDGYRDTLELAEPLLKRYGFRAAAYLPTAFIGETPAERRAYEGVPCLVWTEVRAMQARGTFVFGGHGHEHRNLAVPDDPSADIRACYDALRTHGIRRPYSFCYPHGQYSAAAVAAVRRAGFRSAMICEDQVAQTGKGMNLLALPRVSVMGGRHRFEVRDLPDLSDPAAITVTVRHTGIPLGVSPRLEWRAAGRRRLDWLGPVDVGTGAYAWRWPRPHAGAIPVRLEIWDKHRLFRMWSGVNPDARRPGPAR